MHSQTIVDDCQRISRRPHLAGANEMITAVAILAGEAKPFVVSLQIVSGVVPRGICGVPGWWFSASRTVTSSLDRKSVVWGKSVSVRVDLGGRRIIKKRKKN